MGSVASRVFSTYYLKKIHHDSTVLHYKRSPTWRSLVLFLVLFAFTHYISTAAEYPMLGYVCYALGLYFCYIATEKYEECIFDKSKKTVSLMNARFLEKHLLGYRKRIVTELDELVGVVVDNPKAALGAQGYYQVLLIFLSGLSLSLTAQLTYGVRSEHEAIAKEIKQFLKLPSASSQGEEETEKMEPEVSAAGRNNGSVKKKSKKEKKMD